MKMKHNVMNDLWKSSCFLSFFTGLMFVFWGSLASPSLAYSEDTEDCIDGALVVANTVYIPKLAIEGTNQLYNAHFQIQQEEGQLSIELIYLNLLNCQDSSDFTAALSTDGTLHIPYLDLEGASFWTVDLSLMASPTFMPIKFIMTNANAFGDDILGLYSRPTMSRTVDYNRCFDPDYAKIHCPTK